MKKIFALIAAAMMVVGVYAQEETLQIKTDATWGGSGLVREVLPVDGDISLSLKGQWQSFNIITEANGIERAGYKGMKLEYSRDASETVLVNLVLNYGHVDDEANGTHSWDGTYKALTADNNSVSFDFDEQVPAKITKLIIQQGEAGAANIYLKALYLIKDDGTEVQFKKWATSGDGIGDTFAFGAIKVNGQWNNCQIVDAQGKSLAFDPSENKTYTYTMILEEPTTVGLQLMPVRLKEDGSEDGFGWTVFGINGTTYTAEITPENITSPFALLRLQVFTTADKVEGGYPQIVKIKSITRTVKTVTAIDGVNMEQGEQAVMYNIAGQTVGKNYKGLVIDAVTGKKYVNKK